LGSEHYAWHLFKLSGAKCNLVWKRLTQLR
jgi:hypothetical protein